MYEASSHEKSRKFESKIDSKIVENQNFLEIKFIVNTTKSLLKIKPQTTEKHNIGIALEKIIIKK